MAHRGRVQQIDDASGQRYLDLGFHGSTSSAPDALANRHASLTDCQKPRVHAGGQTPSYLIRQKWSYPVLHVRQFMAESIVYL